MAASGEFRVRLRGGGSRDRRHLTLLKHPPPVQLEGAQRTLAVRATRSEPGAQQLQGVAYNEIGAVDMSSPASACNSPVSADNRRSRCKALSIKCCA